MSTNSCGCESYMDDWNRHKTIECESCKKNKMQQRKERDIRVSKEEGRCIDCVGNDSYGRGEYGGSWFTEGICRKHLQQDLDKVLAKYQLKSIFDMDEIKNNKLIISEYYKHNPRARGIKTKVFEKWVKFELQLHRWNSLM